MRRIRIFAAGAAAAISLGLVASGTVATPSAQAQTIAISHATTALDPKPTVGVNLYVDQNYSLAQVKSWGARDLKYIADTLKLKAVAIDWDYNVPTVRGNVVQVSPTRTPTIVDLAALTAIAKSYGLRVEYRALFAINNKDTRSTSIRPTNMHLWLSSLLFTEAPALELAQRQHVSEFVAGTEMASIDQSPLWGRFFKVAGNIYKGILSYASYGGRGGATTGGFFSKSRVLLPTTEFGASAYPSIALPRHASVTALTRAWERFLTRHTPASLLRLTSIDEIGIPAVSGAYIAPWQWNGLTGPANPRVQARWYRAACNAVNAEHMRGIYFWSMVINDDPAQPYPSLVGFLGRPASLAVIRSCA